MRKQAIFVLGLMFLLSGFAFAQPKVVTNADLEKFKQKRLAAERDLAENYAKMGFDSPEEIARQNEESSRELSEFAAELRRERIARENRQNDYLYFQNESDQSTPNYSDSNSDFIDYQRFYGAGLYYRYPTRRYRNHGNRRYKRPRDFRSRFIRGMPDYIRRVHRFNQINPRRVQRPIKRRPIVPRPRRR